MKNTLRYALTAAILAAAPMASAADVDCVKVSAAVTKAVAADSDNVLEIVSKQVAANTSCACEVVKAAIIASEADKKTVAKIVDAAIVASPENLRVIAQCALAVAPDAVSNIQATVEKYDRAGGGDYPVESEKGVIEAPPERLSANNPLDFPVPGGGGDVAGPRPGGPGGVPLLPPVFPYFPPVVAPPNLTEVGKGDDYPSGGESTGGTDLLR